MKDLEVIIIGGGLAGSCLANGLLNANDVPVKVSVFERDERVNNDKRSGYQIRLGSHALSGFRACLTPDQFDALMTKFGRSGGAISSAPVLFDHNLKERIDLSKFPAYTKSAPISRSLLRDFLQAPLKEKEVLHNGKKFVRFEIVHKDRVRAHFDDGSTQDGDVLVAADGNNSRVNKQLGCNNIVQLRKRQGFLGKCSLPWPVLRTLPKPMLQKGTISCISSNLTLFSAAYLPDNLATLDPSSSDQKPVDYDEESAALMVGMSWLRDPEWPDISKMEDKKQYMLDRLATANWHPAYQSLVKALDPEDIYVVQSRVAKPTPVDWRAKAAKISENENNSDIGHPRVWLMGDAIHPMLPSRGMGANQALHDAADALVPLLRLARHKHDIGSLTERDVQVGLEEYEKKMIPRGFGWVAKSGGTGEDMPNFDGWKGKLTVFFIAQALNVVGLFMSVVKFFGWKPKDDAPELP